MTAPTVHARVSLAVLLCVPPKAGARLRLDPRIVVVELDGASSEALSAVQQAIRTHPSAIGPLGRRVAFLVLLAGFPEAQVHHIAQDPELARLPVFVSPVELGSAEALQAAVSEARAELGINPSFSIPMRVAEPTPEPEAPVRRVPPGSLVNARPSDLRAVMPRLTRLFTRGRNEFDTPPNPAFKGEEAALIAVVTVDGPGAERRVREDQKKFLGGLQWQLVASSDARWLAGSFRAAEDLDRLGVVTYFPDLSAGSTVSRRAEELDLSIMSRSLLSELKLDRSALARRGWDIKWVAVLIVAPEFPYVGVLSNSSFAKLVAETDACLWVGANVDEVPEPLQVDGVSFLTLHSDIAAEVADLLLDGADFRLPPEPDEPDELDEPAEVAEDDDELADA